MNDTATLRQRQAKKPADAAWRIDNDIEETIDHERDEIQNPRKSVSRTPVIGMIVVTVLAFITRFYRISYPSEVVFDEVHFGKFTSYYLQRTYFFDVHPPFGKLLYALIGWLAGFDGLFLFDNIGADYIAKNVPYVALRTFPALLGSLTIPLVYLIMQESGYSVPACLVAACLVLFDNAHISEVRLILLDATLIFSVACALYGYVKFYKQRHVPFSRKWWKWLLITGIALSCVISTKYVGVFTYFTIGFAVVINLWNLLDIKRGLTIQQLAQHVAARMAGLIVLPFFLYLFWFRVHFTILYRSGPGNDFMTLQFQETLVESPSFAKAKTIEFGDTITIRHRDTKVWLHSHRDKYPLRYDDGRISSQGQQVTGYPHNDVNNHWMIQPVEPLSPGEKRIVHHGDRIKLHHIATNSNLLTHNVTSPYHPTNTEFTTVNMKEAYGKRCNDTIFEVKIVGASDGQEFKTRCVEFRLVHYSTKVAMWTHSKPLPDWGHGQQEVNGNNNLMQSANVWYVDEIIGLTNESRLAIVQREPKPMPFITKYLELQAAMFRYNNMLTSDHPFASAPIQWPFLLRGISFWSKDDTRAQIYFLGNPIGWWITSCFLAVLGGIFIGDQLTRRRGNHLLDDAFRARLYNSAGFFLLAWAAHFLPFFLMGRQLFLHHYLPSHLIAALVTGATVQLLFETESMQEQVSRGNKKKRSGHRPLINYLKSPLSAWIVAAVLIGMVFASFLFYTPITYGTPGLDVAQMARRQWLHTWDFLYAK